MSDFGYLEQEASPSGDAVETLSQVAKICADIISGPIEMAPDGMSFLIKNGRSARSGLLAAGGMLTERSIIELRLELARGPSDMPCPSGKFFHALAELGEAVTLCEPDQLGDNQVSLQASIKIQATQLSFARQGLLLERIKKIEALAFLLEQERPERLDDKKLKKMYQELSEVLEPIAPRLDLTGLPILKSWAIEIREILKGSCSVAIHSPSKADLDFCLNAIAGVMAEQGSSIASLKVPSLNPKAVLDLAIKAPGAIVVPSVSLALSVSPYELANDSRAMLRALTESDKPVIFTGSWPEHQANFQGGQGGAADPLAPVVSAAPEIPLRQLVDFLLSKAGTAKGGLSTTQRQDLAQRVMDTLARVPEWEAKRLLPATVKQAVSSLSGPIGMDGPSYVETIRGLKDTFSGLGEGPRGERAPRVQDRFLQVMADRDQLYAGFTRDLVGQDRALLDLASRLSAEVLTRPLHQPIRYLAQGTPGTGKSESAQVLARALDIPYVNIDLSAMPGYEEALAQLLGSGRGLVGSYRAGRLEEIAKTGSGVVCEISDLDHAPAYLRGPLADLFLGIMETGLAQSTAGATFSVANVILAYTINLPNGRDERAHTGIGFVKPTAEKMDALIYDEVKQLLSGAFLSRVGSPIRFDLFTPDAAAQIIERGLVPSLAEAVKRIFGESDITLRLEPDLGRQILDSFEPRTAAGGARVLLERARALAALAAMVMLGEAQPLQPQTTVRVGFDRDQNQLVVQW